MFELYSGPARQAVFWAVHEAKTFGSESFETHHLLLGVLRANPAIAGGLLKSDDALEDLRTQFRTRFPFGKEIPPGADHMLTDECQRALSYADDEAYQMRHDLISTWHILLGLLREEGSAAAEALRGYGVELVKLREQIAASPEREPPAQ